MNKKQITNIVRELYTIISRPISDSDNTSLFEAARSYDYYFAISNDPERPCEKTWPIDHANDALEVMHLFSDEPKRSIEETQLFNLDQTKLLYLHFWRAPKIG